MGFLLRVAIFIYLFICVRVSLCEYYLSWSSIVYCGWLTLQSKPFASGGFFMWPGFFFFLCKRVFLRILLDLNWMFLPDSTKHFSYACSDQTEEKSFIFLGDHPHCSLHLSTLSVTRTLLLWAALSSCSVWVAERTWSVGAYGASTNTPHPWWIRSVWLADLASWHQTWIGHAPRNHHRLGKVPQCPAFTLGLLIRKAVV